MKTIFENKHTHTLYNIKMVVLKARNVIYNIVDNVLFVWLCFGLTKEGKKISAKTTLRKWTTFSAASIAWNIFYVARIFFLFSSYAKNDHFHIQFSLFRIWFAEVFIWMEWFWELLVNKLNKSCSARTKCLKWRKIKFEKKKQRVLKMCTHHFQNEAYSTMLLLIGLPISCNLWFFFHSLSYSLFEPFI